MQTIETDILIIGGGSAGVAAAVASSSLYQKVTLVERLEYLGGKATAAEVGTICGLYKFKKAETSEYLVGGFAKQFAEQLAKLSTSTPLYNIYNLHYLPYNISAYKELCMQLMRENNINLLLNSEVKEVQVAHQSIKSILVKSENKIIQINCKSIIDCSGNSIISQLAKLPIIKSEKYQAAAQVFTVKGVDKTIESNLNLIVLKEIKKAILNHQLDDSFKNITIVQGSYQNDCVSFKLGIPIIVTNSKDNLEKLREKAIEMIHQFIHHFINHVNLFKNSSLQNIASEVGVRVGVRPVGKYILNEEDVLSCKKFDTAIANCSWPIEEWKEDKGVAMRYLNHNDFYQIPADSLISSQVSNLFFGGRNISATDEAIASARVIGICLQTGYASGIIASNNILNTPLLNTIEAIQAKQIFV